MCDALDRNLPKGHKVIESNCGSHARRRFVDQAENFPTECRYLLETFGKVFKVDELCRTQRLSDDERLRQHEQESGPVMAELKTWMQDQFLEKRVEPNSGLGEAIRYMLDRWDKFTLFLKLPGAPLHNNIVERALKLAIRHRNNSLFYRSERGARVGDIYMTLIHTTELQGENPFHYLTQLMCHESAVADDPAAWLPWNYRDTLACFLRDATSPRDERPRPL
jgi:transposase